MFSVVRKGYDHEEVTQHLSRLDAEMKILATDGAAAVAQANQLTMQLDATMKELEASRAEVERLKADLRIMGGPADTVERMSERLQVLLRLSQDEFGEKRAEVSAQAAAHAAEIIAAVGDEDLARPLQTALDSQSAGYNWAEPDAMREIERMRIAAAEERARLDEEAIVARGQAEEEFRRTLALRCREAMAQFAAMHSEAKRTAQAVLDEADERAKSMLSEAGQAVNHRVDEARREVGVLHTLRTRLTQQLDATRKLLNGAIPGDSGPDEIAAPGASDIVVPAPSNAHEAESYPPPQQQQPQHVQPQQPEPAMSLPAQTPAQTPALHAVPAYPGPTAMPPSHAAPPPAEQQWNGNGSAPTT